MTARFIDRHLPSALARVAHAVDAEWAALLERGGAGHPSAARVLLALSDVASERVTPLSRICLLQQPTATKLLDAMVRDGLVSRRQDPRDRRRVVLASLTPAGAARAERLVALAEAHGAHVLARLPTLAGPALPAALEALEAEGRT